MCHKKSTYVNFYLKFYNLFINSLQRVENITAIGTDINIPTVPKIETAEQIENNNQTGCIPVFFPMYFGVMKFESIKGIIK